MWWIRTANTVGAGAWSAGLTFTVPMPSDTTPPSIAIATPSTTGTYTASTATLAMSGTASDNVAVTQVSWSTDRGGSGVATGTTAWTIGAVPLGAGVTVVTVVARDAANNTATATLTVTYNAPPGPATLVAPTGTITTTTPSFTWHAVSGATDYQLWVNDAGQQARINATYTAAAAGCAAGTGTCSVSPGVALAAGAAMWWIRTSNGAGEGSWSAGLAFVVPPPADSTVPPGPATLVAPSGIISTATPAFTWQAVSGATEYQLWVNDASQQARINATYSAAAAGCPAGTGTCTISPAVTLAPGAALWWIRTSNAAGGAWSAGLAFLVPTGGGTSVPPGPATLVAPSGTISTTIAKLHVAGGQRRDRVSALGERCGPAGADQYDLHRGAGGL